MAAQSSPPSPPSPRGVPHYLRFARAVALVSVTLPIPVIAVEYLAGCSGGPATTEQTPPAEGIQSTGTQPAPGVGPAPGIAPGVAPGPPTGVKPCVDCNQDAAADTSTKDAADSGGGPSFGLPELPASWRVA